MAAMQATPNLLHLKQTFFEEMNPGEREAAQFPENMVVFFGIQGTDHFFFQAAEKATDPPVYYYMDGCGRYFVAEETLSGWFFEHGTDLLTKVKSFMDECTQ